MPSKIESLIILTPGFPVSEADENCLPMQQYFIKEIREEFPEIEITVLAFQYPYHTNKYEWNGIKVIPFNGKNKGGVARIAREFYVGKEIRNIIKEKRASGIISFWYGECAKVGKKAADTFNLPHLCWILGRDAINKEVYNRKIKLSPNNLVALSDFLQNEFGKTYNVKPQYVIPPGINSKWNADLDPDKEIDLLAAGSFIPLKNFSDFLKLLVKLREDFPQLKAVLAGDGPERESLLAQSAALGLEGILKMPGEIPHSHLLTLMRKTKVFIHPSTYEGFSGVCQEALWAGASVISYTKPMKRDIEKWYQVKTFDEMVNLSNQLLKSNAKIKERSIPYSMRDTVHDFLNIMDAD